MTRTWSRVIDVVLVTVAGGLLLSGPLPSPGAPQVVVSPVSVPSLPSVPSALPTQLASPISTPGLSAPATSQPGGVSHSGSTAPPRAPSAGAPHAGAPPATAAPHGVSIPLTGIYVSSPLDAALIGALVTLPLLFGIWLLLFGRTFAEARRARESQARLLLAADLGLHPRDLTSLSTKSLFSLREKAAFDELTGVLRRAAGIAAAEREIARARRHKTPLTIAFIDVDGLKEANDRHGHAAGDDLLRALVQALRQGLRGQDVVFRYGGDEFVCLLPDTAAKAARSTLGGIQVEAAKTGVRFCAGVAQLERSDDVVSLFARADQDLYEFKTKRGEIVQLPPQDEKRRSKRSATASRGLDSAG